MSAPSNSLDNLQGHIGNLAVLLGVLCDRTNDQEFVRPNGSRVILADEISAVAHIARDLADGLNEDAEACHQKVLDDAREAGAAPAVVGPIFEPARLSIEGLFALFNGLGTVHEVLNGILSQPRFTQNDDPHSLNPAGGMLEEFKDGIAKARESIRTEALARVPTAQDRDAARLVFFVAEEWVDGSCAPVPALDGLTKALAGMGKAASK